MREIRLSGSVGGGPLKGAAYPMCAVEALRAPSSLAFLRGRGRCCVRVAKVRV